VSDWKAYTVIGTNVVIDCGTVEEAIAYERELWANQPYAPATPAPLDVALPPGDPTLMSGYKPAKRTAATSVTPAPLDVTPEAAVMGTDARLWASEFVRLFGNDPDEGTMLGWFANAIEAGRAATPAPLDGRIAAMKLPMVEPVGSKKTDAINSQRASWNAALDAAAREFATPAPLDVERLADALPLGEPTMHAHDGLGIHRAEAHHRPEDYRP